MATRTSDILRLLEQSETALTNEYLRAIEGIRSRAQIGELADAVERNNLEAVIVAAGIRAGQWSLMLEEARTAYRKAGELYVAGDVPQRFGAVFNLGSRGADRWLRSHAGQLVTRINDEQRAAIRQAMGAGVSQGRHPRSIALDIVGRVSPATGRRSGGIVGLAENQAQWVANAREQLATLDRGYFKRKRRDRRFDALIRRHIETGTAIPQAKRDQVIARYEARLLQTRGETIGRTEALNALNEASDESLRQIVADGIADAENVVRIWDATADGRTRPDHADAEGQERGLDEPFTIGGIPMMRPGEGPAHQVINCRCVLRHRIEFNEVSP